MRHHPSYWLAVKEQDVPIHPAVWFRPRSDLRLRCPIKQSKTGMLVQCKSRAALGALGLGRRIAVFVCQQQAELLRPHDRTLERIKGSRCAQERTL